MKKLTFPLDNYTQNSDLSYIYTKTEYSIIGTLELLWLAVDNSEVKDLSKKDHKTNKGLKAAIREISIYKDKDQDSRISLTEQTLVLEDEQLHLLKRHLESNHFSSKVSEDVDRLWEIIDSAQDYKLTQVKDA